MSRFIVWPHAGGGAEGVGCVLGHLHLERVGTGAGEGSGKEERLHGHFLVIKSLNRSYEKYLFIKIRYSRAQRGSFLLL